MVRTLPVHSSGGSASRKGRVRDALAPVAAVGSRLEKRGSEECGCCMHVAHLHWHATVRSPASPLISQHSGHDPFRDLSTRSACFGRDTAWGRHGTVDPTELALLSPPQPFPCRMQATSLAGLRFHQVSVAWEDGEGSERGSGQDLQSPNAPSIRWESCWDMHTADSLVSQNRLTQATRAGLQGLEGL